MPVMKPMKPKKKVPPMTPTQLISVINQSKRVSDADVAAMTKAVAKQVSNDVSKYYGLVPALEFVKPGGTPTPGGAPCYVIDIPDVDGALGYHDEGDDGVPYIKVFVNPVLDNGGTALVGSLSLSAVLSHEVLELIGDGPANRWVDGPSGSDFAAELCDACQDTFYVVDGVSVSNFVLQAFFDPKAQKGSRFDFMGKLMQPFSMTSGGYQITRTEPGRVSQVFGSHRAMAVSGVELGVVVHFGEHFPTWREAATVEKARRKRAKR